METYVRLDQIKDPITITGPIPKVLRDYGRCPMQWDSSVNAGMLNFDPNIGNEN